MAVMESADPGTTDPGEQLRPPRPPGRSRMAASQVTWLVIGFVVLIVVCVIASQNLQQIYNSQKDFVVGTLLSLTGFSFAKAFTRTQEQRAQEQLRAALRQKIALLERNVTAAGRRLGEYYHAEAPKFEYYHRTRLLQVVIDDLDHCRGDLQEINHILGEPVRRSYAVDGPARTPLEAAGRALEEAANRRDQLFDLLRSRLDPDLPAADTWDIFHTMTADTLKAKQMVEEILRPASPRPPGPTVTKAKEYVTAALRRAEQFELMLDRPDVPQIYQVMRQDLRDAGHCLGQFLGDGDGREEEA